MNASPIVLTLARWTMQRLWPFRGAARLVRIFNRIYMKASGAPVLEVRMSLGHRLRLDVRSGTELLAAYLGTYNDELVSLLLKVIPLNGISVDVGANVGLFAVPLGMRAKGAGGQVHAFEPVRSNHSRLVENVALNGLESTVVVKRVGLADQAKEVNIALREDFASGSQTGNASIVINDGADAAFAIEQITLDTLDRCAESGAWGRLDFLKIDVEGQEGPVISGGRTILATFRPVVLTEVNKAFLRRRGVDGYEEIRRSLPLGYRSFAPVYREGTILRSRHIVGLQSIESLDQCKELDDLLWIPAEQLDRFKEVVALPPDAST